MKAYQYFWRNGHVIGRARAGTMGFDTKQGHNHWHFEQFARYPLLDSAKNAGGAQPQGRLLHRPDATRWTCCCRTPLAAAVHRLQRPVRLADRAVGAGR